MKVAELEYRDDELTLTVKIDGDKTTDEVGKELMDAINAYYNKAGTTTEGGTNRGSSNGGGTERGTHE